MVHLMKKKIILASRSPRRKQLLEWAELDFDILVKETEETYPPDMPVSEVPVFIARQKAQAALATTMYHRYEEGVPVLAADTVVVIDQDIIGKPADREEAIRMLTRLSGRSHTVITGVVISDGKKEVAFSDHTEVEFNTLPMEAIEYYVDKYEPYDKAGSYAIQEWIGVLGIRSIHGDFYNVMGLPVNRVVRALISDFP
jgi:septum formation protein